MEENDKLITYSEQKIKNQKVKELHLKKILKKSIIYSSVICVIGLGTLGCYHGLNKYEDYVSSREGKIAYYQQKFDKVKDYYQKGYYFRADDLSEKLQEELDQELFFSPTNKLYAKVREYDNMYIDPEVKRLKREGFYRKLMNLQVKAIDYLSDKWNNASNGQKGIACVCGLLFAIYLWKKKIKY